MRLGACSSAVLFSPLTAFPPLIGTCLQAAVDDARLLTVAMEVLMRAGAAEHIRRVRDTHDDDGARDDTAGDAHGNGGNGNDGPPQWQRPHWRIGQRQHHTAGR